MSLSVTAANCCYCNPNRKIGDEVSEASKSFRFDFKNMNYAFSTYGNEK